VIKIKEKALQVAKDLKKLRVSTDVKQPAKEPTGAKNPAV